LAEYGAIDVVKCYKGCVKWRDQAGVCNTTSLFNLPANLL